MYWLRLGWLEWRRSFLQGKPNRDFCWLTLLLFLTLLLAVLLKGTQEGLLNKFIDVSIGHVEKTGIPIRIAMNRGKDIDREMLNETKNDFKLYPYREVVLPEIGFSNSSNEEENIWKNKDDTFTGWAIAFDDPLWQMNMKDQIDPSSTFQKDQFNIPLTVILNRSLFEEFFDCESYLKNLYHIYPFLKKGKNKKNNNKLYCLTDDSKLWLSIKTGDNRELLPFHIYWQKHIPAIGNVALLMPISILNTLTVNKDHHLEYDPLFANNEGKRIKQIRQSGESDYLKTIKQKCFPTASLEKESLLNLESIPETLFKQCIKILDIPLINIGDNTPKTPYIQIVDAPSPQYSFQYNKEDNIIVSCRKNCKEKWCENKENSALGFPDFFVCEEKLQIDAVRAIGGYSHAFAYADNRITLNNEVEKIKNFPIKTSIDNKYFYIPTTYEDALKRFSFITEIMKLFERHYKLLFFVFLFALLLAQVGIIITHRKHNYGIYLSKGISSLKLHLIVLLQITLSFLVTFIMIVPFIKALQLWLSNDIQTIISAERYINHISATHLNLLPISLSSYTIIATIFLAILYIIAIFLLQIMITKEALEPAHLL